MQPLRDFFSVPAPAMRFVSPDREEKTWTCSICGTISPLTLSGGWYVRRRCPCEERAEEQRVIAALREETARARIALTYTWLGATWSETGLAGKTFATFRREAQPGAYDLVHAFAMQPQGVLALYGDNGTGKTHMLAAIANHLRVQGTACLFASAVTLFDAIGDRIQHEQDYLDLIGRAVQTPLLLLDDVDKLKPSEFREEVLYKLINGRTNANRPLALSSNHTPDDLERWVGRAGRSRLMQGLIPVAMQGADFRLQVSGGTP